MFRRFLKFAGASVVGLLCLVAVAMALVYARSNFRMRQVLQIEPTALAIIPTDSLAERGRHLVMSRGCVDCHGEDLGGRMVIDDPAAGRFYAPNLTRGEGGLPVEYSDVDYVRAIRHGVDRSGRPLLLMPSHEYTQMSDEDVAAMISYLKTVPDVSRPRQPTVVGPLIRVMMLAGKVKIAAEEIDHTAARPVAVVASVSADYGRYLANSCIGCHGENLAGGPIPGAPPQWPAAANLTPHASSRLPAWSEEQFVAALRTARRPDNSEIDPVMPRSFAQLNDTELRALWAYLKTVPAAGAN